VRQDAALYVRQGARRYFPAIALQTQCRHHLILAQAEEDKTPKFFVVNGMPSTIPAWPIQERKLRHAAGEGDLLTGSFRSTWILERGQVAATTADQAGSCEVS
jgi:hypothetical protein